MKIGNVLVVYTKFNLKRQKSTISAVKAALGKSSIRNRLVERTRLNKKFFNDADFVIAVGGDGTFLRAAQFIFDETPLLGVNSDPEKKEGFFMQAAGNDFNKKLKKILNNNYKIKKLHRLEAFIGNKKVHELALNEFYIAAERPYLTARYLLYAGKKKERQKSSGILIATAAGSNAWLKSAGGKVLPLNSDKFEYLVREPYCGKVSAKCKLVNGVVNKNEKLGIVFEVGNGILVSDSLSKEYKFRMGQKVTIQMSKKPIHMVSFG